MKANKLEAFRQQICRQLQEFSSQKPVNIKSDQERLEQIQQFYRVYEQQLAFLLEDTQVENPVTNTIFLIHQMDLLVNDHFGLRKEVAIA